MMQSCEALPRYISMSSTRSRSRAAQSIFSCFTCTFRHTLQTPSSSKTIVSCVSGRRHLTQRRRLLRTLSGILAIQRSLELSLTSGTAENGLDHLATEALRHRIRLHRRFDLAQHVAARAERLIDFRVAVRKRRIEADEEEHAAAHHLLLEEAAERERVGARRVLERDDRARRQSDALDQRAEPEFLRHRVVLGLQRLPLPPAVVDDGLAAHLLDRRERRRERQRLAAERRSEEHTSE